MGAGHLWNDSRKTADIMYRLGSNQWLIQPETAYTPPGKAQIVNLDISQQIPKAGKQHVVIYNLV